MKCDNWAKYLNPIVHILGFVSGIWKQTQNFHPNHEDYIIARKTSDLSFIQA